MPTYEYKCQHCNHRFEVFQKITEEPLTECTRCHGPVKRLIGPGAGLLFKGSGFYITDYRSESYKQAEKKAAGEAGAPKPAGDAPGKGAAKSGTSAGSGGSGSKE